jgi:hypothetical protein
MNSWKAYADKLADKLMDAGNITFAALIVGQLISRQPFNWALAGIGGVAWLGFYVFAWILVRLASR